MMSLTYMTDINRSDTNQPRNSHRDSWDRFRRWQKITIDQFGYALNLILIYAIAGLGYCFVLLKDDHFIPGSSAKCTVLLSLFALGLSTICGIGCVLNRLRDFRATQKRTNPGSGPGQDTPTKEEVDQMGQSTWVLFYTHVSSFMAGVIFLAATLLLTYGGKLR